MDQLILAVSECNAAEEIICVPANINELFELPFVGPVNRTIILMFVAAAIAVAIMYFGVIRSRNRLVPSKFGAFSESIVGFVRDEIAIGIIGRDKGLKYFPWLLAVFMFVLVGNMFEVTPLVNFPITSRISIPLFLAVVTWVIYIASGLREYGFKYISESVFPPGVPKPLYLLVAPIELVSTFLVRPFSLAVRLFANLTAGHVMLSLLLVSGWVFTSGAGGLAKVPIGVGWFVLGLAIYLFEIVVAILQAYIFTLLSAVYVQTAVHMEH